MTGNSGHSDDARKLVHIAMGGFALLAIGGAGKRQAGAIVFGFVACQNKQRRQAQPDRIRRAGL